MAAAQLRGDGQGFVNAGNLLAASGMPGPAAVAFDRAAVTFDAEANGPRRGKQLYCAMSARPAWAMPWFMTRTPRRTGPCH